MKHVKKTLAGAMLVLVPVIGLADRPASKNPETRRIHEDMKKTLGVVPEFMKLYPEAALPGAWEVEKGFYMNPDTALDNKQKELVGLAVASQIPCRYCTLFHERFARFFGATDAEIDEAIALAAQERLIGHILGGSPGDEAAMRREIDQAFAYLQKQKSAKAGAMGGADQAQVFTDAAAAERDIQQTFGAVPTPFRLFPKEGLAGLWSSMKSLQMGANTAIEPKYKAMISLAVASEMSHTGCVYFNQRSAEFNGATPEEMKEAVAMGALTRHWSTVLNGHRVDEKSFEKQVDAMIKHAEKSKATAQR